MSSLPINKNCMLSYKAALLEEVERRYVRNTTIIYADPDFGSCQAKELSDHLESVFDNEPVSVKSGLHIVEVKPQGVNKRPNSRPPSLDNAAKG
ncbi:OLC1v1005029C1 [Oldenlandia corymbosa var. corymbosa]|uniref:OLC1v1005029C1 n=1 Tax=Oldenlandia corymbosa var. corymbosa TaxID=529605 RepID=A0AAV1DFN9_OLDCO|nr:OLC1v1005029C1 [Oldenlandia corymbosa var. corymbosa]